MIITSANYRWRKRNPVLPNSSNTGDDFPEPPAVDQSPRKYFDQFLEPTFFTYIAEQSNLYSVQQIDNSVNTNAHEIEQFIGILVQMGVLKYPQYQMYWSPKTRASVITDVMGLTRFENLKRFFHLNDN